MKSNKLIKEDIMDELNSELYKMNLDAPNEISDLIDKKLSILFNNMKYSDYINFIKNSKYLKMYDDLMGKYANNEPISNMIVKVLPNSMYQKVLKVVENKIIELKLNQ